MSKLRFVDNPDAIGEITAAATSAANSSRDPQSNQARRQNPRQRAPRGARNQNATPPSPEQELVSECSICMAKPVDCVILDCGHQSTCYECGLNLWQGQGSKNWEFTLWKFFDLIMLTIFVRISRWPMRCLSKLNCSSGQNIQNLNAQHSLITFIWLRDQYWLIFPGIFYCTANTSVIRLWKAKEIMCSSTWQFMSNYGMFANTLYDDSITKSWFANCQTTITLRTTIKERFFTLTGNLPTFFPHTFANRMRALRLFTIRSAVQ